MRNDRIDANGALKPEKTDTTKNGDVNIETLKKRDKNKIPLRIDEITVIYVKPCNCTPEYAQAYRDKLKAIIIQK